MHTRIIMACIAAIFAGACSVSRYVPDNEYFLKDIKISSDNKKILKNYSLRDYIVQTPNTNWFGAKVPLKIYCLSGTDTTKWNCRLLRKLGESPVIYDSAATEKSKRNIVNMLFVLWEYVGSHFWKKIKRHRKQLCLGTPPTTFPIVLFLLGFSFSITTCIRIFFLVIVLNFESTQIKRVLKKEGEIVRLFHIESLP